MNTTPPAGPRIPLSEELAGVFARMSGLLLSEETVETSLTPLSSLAHETVPGSCGAGVSALTAATDSFVLAGRLEPSYDIGGDVFDYALSQQTVSLGIFDAVGHGTPAALMAAATLAAYRSSRRDGRSVFDQARAIDDVLSGTFPRSQFVTGLIAEVDIPSGRLR